MSWPVYFKDRLVVGNPNSNTAIATLWTPMSVVAKMVDVSRLSVIGQLYTKRGINYLMRNVMLNPRITRLMLVGADLMGAGEALLRISNFRYQNSDLKTINLESGILNLKSLGWLDEAIDTDAVADFAKNVAITNSIGPVKPEKLEAFVSGSSAQRPWAKPRKFSEPSATGSGGLPSEESGFTVCGNTVWETWIRVLAEIMRFGHPSPMIHHYGNERITELINLVAVVAQENLAELEIPRWFPYSKSDITKYVDSFLKASRGDEAYTYGERLKAFPLDYYKSDLFNYLNNWSNQPGDNFRKIILRAIEGKRFNQQQIMVEKLKSFGENKGALAVLWEPVIDNFGLREIWRTPCLVLVQAMIRENRLFMTAYFRSNDMYGGWPLNVFGLRAFQQEVASQVGDSVKLGPLTTVSFSAHIYESSWQAAEKLVHDYRSSVSCQWDPRGNLNIEVQGEDIVVKHLSPDGIPLDEYRQNGMEPKAPRNLCFKLESAGVFSAVGNAMYAARQIERAATAVKLSLPFTSDEELDLKKLKVGGKI